MASERSFVPHRLIMGLLFSPFIPLDTICEELTKLYGPIVKRSECNSFSFTDYYNEEMGGEPQRCYLCFEQLVDPSTLADIKHQTNALETRYSIDGARKVNLDPGLLSLANVILATTKGRAHRIPLYGGIYAELTLMYVNKGFQSFAWTYQDYNDEKVKNLFCVWRKEYKQQLKQEGYL